MKTRRLTLSALFSVVCFLAVLANILMAGEVREPTVFRDRVMFRGSTGVTGVTLQYAPVKPVTNATATITVTPQLLP